MPEYVERSKLMDHIELNAREYEESYDAWQILGDVEDFPAADVAAVKHGRWEKWKPPYLGMEYSHDLMACSECGFAMHNALRIPAHYCPNCGAKMDGGEAE
jgi:hypothetical protein